MFYIQLLLYIFTFLYHYPSHLTSPCFLHFFHLTFIYLSIAASHLLFISKQYLSPLTYLITLYILLPISHPIHLLIIILISATLFPSYIPLLSCIPISLSHTSSIIYNTLTTSIHIIILITGSFFTSIHSMIPNFITTLLTHTIHFITPLLTSINILLQYIIQPLLTHAFTLTHLIIPSIILHHPHTPILFHAIMLSLLLFSIHKILYAYCSFFHKLYITNKTPSPNPNPLIIPILLVLITFIKISCKSILYITSLLSSKSPSKTTAKKPTNPSSSINTSASKSIFSFISIYTSKPPFSFISFLWHSSKRTNTSPSKPSSSNPSQHQKHTKSYINSSILSSLGFLKTTSTSTHTTSSSSLPSLSLLASSTDSHSHKITWNQHERTALLKTVLKDYNIKGNIISYNIGPVVTLYKFEPEPGLKESIITSLTKDIARSMSALSVRIASIPGHNLIGIELSNPTRKTVYLKELLQSQAFQHSSGLALALGCDISGQPFIANLETMPHMLIAGTTGSGKSVSIHTLLLSILYKHTPTTCKLIMIDPKMLELSIYKDLPHLLIPVVTNPKLAVIALKWAIQEMERRYEIMSHLQVRNISEYNILCDHQSNQTSPHSFTNSDQYSAISPNPFDKNHATSSNINNITHTPSAHSSTSTHTQADPLTKFPYIIIIVDELADLMLVSGKDIDESIQRLAQMARASGIHLILATQRPSVDVITGTIKANFPTRLTFQLASSIDSRTILGDKGGADQLLGKGDMLYLNLNSLTRAHGPYVSNHEVEAVVKHWKAQQSPQYQELTLTHTDSDLTDQQDDPLFSQVIDYVYRTKKATASSIQREFSIGFNRAAKYLDTMEKMGKISPPDSMGRRKLLT